MLDIRFSVQFKKDFKHALKQGLSEEKLTKVLEYLVNDRPLPRKYRDHALAGSRKYKNARECHIQPDWLLIYRILKSELVLELLRTGSHSDLF